MAKPAGHVTIKSTHPTPGLGGEAHPGGVWSGVGWGTAEPRLVRSDSMSNAPISLVDLETLTGDHWARNDSTWYIQNLLGHEMEYAQQQVEDCDTLALLVGFSPDPLLQTIWKYRPKRIVLVLNHKYGKQPGKHRADEYVTWIGQMVSMDYCPSAASARLSTTTTKREDIAIAETEAQPDWIFRELRDRLLSDQRAGKRIVVDITGAKKNMASGAFLFEIGRAHV